MALARRAQRRTSVTNIMDTEQQKVQYELDVEKALVKKLKATRRTRNLEYTQTGGGFIGVADAATFELMKHTLIKYYRNFDEERGSAHVTETTDASEKAIVQITIRCQLDTVPGWWRTVQAFMIISILVLAGAIGLALLFAIMKDKKFLAIFSGLAGGAGAGLALLGAIIFAAKVAELEVLGGLHAGFGLAIVAAVVAIPGALLMILSRDSN